MNFGQATDGQRVLRFANGLQMRTRDIKVGLYLFTITIILVVISLNVGVTNVGIREFTHMLFGYSLDHHQFYALWVVRIPHILLGLMVGWCAALAGAILQPIARNPLADPSLLGISQGSMTMIIVLLAFIPSAPKMLIVIAALGGGLIVALFLTLLVGNNRASGLAILLMGIAVSSVLSSVSSFLILYLPTELSLNLSGWMQGSLFQANWSIIASFMPLFLLSIIGILLTGPALNRYELGNELAMSLGEPIKYSRPLLMMFSVLLSAASVTTVGPLSFVGILAPHLASFISSATGRARLFLSALVGGNLVVAADIMTKAVPSEVFLPIGLSFTLIGVPLFILTMRLNALRKR
ncbi:MULTISPECIES: FecCD family ABC transporter permease [Xenorhabdus]|uniref:FecCD family ABC transporter permease n=1 Tax=Xenorhabdus TaxID=626 RepID=UPI00064A4684|nr:MULTISPECIES: iron ABC transporter permease [Xenorhabdus]KLU16778.1 ABC transporter permease [Xenorhabdus griffiniae]KOP31985.1 ABC transporter permease [Xenorhabdus sp. GDc328]